MTTATWFVTGLFWDFVKRLYQKFLDSLALALLKRIVVAYKESKVEPEPETV